VVIRRLKSRPANLDQWRVAKKIQPSQRGAIKLARTYGSELLCVRYRENPEGTERLTTLELVVERTVIQKRDDPIVAFKIKQDEIELRRPAMTRGAKYDARTYLWKLQRSEVLRMGLKNRIVVSQEEIYQEHAPM